MNSGLIGNPALQISLDLAGTFVFALNGGLTAMDAERLDIVGVLTLGMITALGGGVVRDVLIGSVPPAAFRDWRYLAVAAGGALVAFVSRPRLTRLETPIDLFDAGGLSLFCVSGAATAFAFHLGLFQSAILGTITGVGGGTIRDMMIRRVPTVLTSGLYAIPAFCGAFITATALDFHFYGPPIAVVAAAVCFLIRLAGIRYKLNVPTSQPAPSGGGRHPENGKQ